MQQLRTLQSLIDGLAEHGERPAAIAFHKQQVEQWSYGELTDRVRRLAWGLDEAHHIGPGESVALLAGNRPEAIMACLAVIQAGAVIVPLDVQFADATLRHVLIDSGARILFTTAEQVARLARLDAKLKPILLDGDEEHDRGWRRLLAKQVGAVPRIQPDNPAALFYTSGTTGPPKGVPLSHGNLAFELNALRAAELVSRDDRVLVPLPLHHVYAFVIGMLAPLTFGVPIILPHSLTGPQVIRALREGQATMILGVPRLYRALVAAIEARARSGGLVTGGLFKAGAAVSTWLRRRLGLLAGKLLLRSLHRQFGSNLRDLVSAGAALDPDLVWKLEGFGWRVGSGYGLTETAPSLTMNPPGRGRIGSVGRPLPGVDIRIDRAAQSAAPEPGQPSPVADRRQEGEIQARGPNVFTGYRNLPDKTAEAFTADGWFRTGDLGYFDDAGYLYVTGRISTLIKTEGGEKVQVEDLEAAYLDSPIIGEIAILPRDNRLVALVVPKLNKLSQNGKEGDQAVRAALDERSKTLPSHQRIADFAVTREPLPRTQLGKIRRHELAERYDRAKKEGPGAPAAGPMGPEEMSGEDRALLDDPAPRRTWDWLAGRYPDRRLTPDTSLQLDLGIDSMEWLNLTLEIRQYAGVELSEEAIGRIETVRDLLREVAEQGETAGTASRASPVEHPEQVLTDRQKRWLKPVGRVASLFAWCVFALNRALMRILFRLRAQGLKNVPAHGPFILAPNHVSHLDGPAVAAALDERRWGETYWGAEFGNLLSRVVTLIPRVLPLQPAALSSLAFGAAVLKRGWNLVWFPEGQRSRTGQLGPFKSGIGMLLEHFRVPVIPVFIHGTDKVMAPGKILPRLSPVTVIFGAPQ